MTNANRATFKVVRTESAIPESKKEEKVDESVADNAGRMLKTEEIREICDKHGLSRMDVYNIRSQFAGMCIMSKEADIKIPEDEKDKKGNKGFGVISEGISLAFFKKNCLFLAGCLPQIIERILVAHGLDIQSNNAQVDWQTYLELYCIFEAGMMEKTSLIRFWIKFFDNGLRGTVPEEEYLNLLEELIRGNTLKKASKTTVMFAKMFQKMMANAGCLGENKEIINDKLSAAFEREEIDIQLLCSALGRQSLDEKFLNIEI